MMDSPTLAIKIDHTLLKPEASNEQITQLCKEAREYNFYSVCVHGYRLGLARRELANSPVKLCSVVGFPTGAHLRSVKANEARHLVDAGAHELDMVMNIGALKDRNEVEVIEDIEAVIRAADGIPVKVIIETALLTEAEKIRACEAVVKSGAAFVKTSTGFYGGATVEDIHLIRKHVGSSVQIKASGGIQSYSQALDLIRAGANRIGSSRSVHIIEEERKQKQ